MKDHLIRVEIHKPRRPKCDMNKHIFEKMTDAQSISSAKPSHQDADPLENNDHTAHPIQTTSTGMHVPQNQQLSSTVPSLQRPTHAPIPTTTKPLGRSGVGGFQSALNSQNPTFTVLKATAFQQAVGHPMAYVRALMQMGYEPLPYYKGKNLFGKEATYYPNVFRYLRFVYNIDGFTGIYRGFGCSLMAKVVCWYTTTKVDELLGPVNKEAQNEQVNLTWNKCLQKTLREVQCQSFGILISHPLQVMAVRCMAQFIGREETYSSINIFQNAVEIFQRQGIGGFFVGLIPRWLLEVSTIVISNFLIHLLKTQIPAQQEMAPLFEYLAAFVAQSITYPLSVVTTVSTVNRSGLIASLPPIAPVGGFANWQDTYKYLQRHDQLKRGSSLINRMVTGPV